MVYHGTHMFTVYLKKQSIVLHIKIKLLDARMKGKFMLSVLFVYVDLEEKTLKHTPYTGAI